MPYTAFILSILTLVLGGIAVLSMLRLQGGASPSSLPLRMVHKIAGWCFILIFFFITVYHMLPRLAYWENSSPAISLHIATFLLISMLVLIKVVIARYYRSLSRIFLSLGIAIYVTTFVHIGITSLHKVSLSLLPEIVLFSNGPYDREATKANLGMSLCLQKCSTCHVLQTIMQPRSEKEWDRIIKRMVRISYPRITPSEGEMIYSYLSKEFNSVGAGDGLTKK